MKNIAFIIIFAVAINIQAQNVLSHRYYINNYSVINPSCVNLYTRTMVGIFSHHQWLGLKNYPYTQGIVASGVQNETGWGIGILNNRWGTMGNLSLNLNYAYRAKLNSEWDLSTGISANVNQFTLNQTNYLPTDINDPALSYNKEKAILPNFNAGITLHNNLAHIGISIMNVLQNKYKLTINEDDLNKMVRFYALHGAYLFAINEEFGIQPSILIMKNNYQKIFFDATATAIYDEKYSFGLSFTSVKEVSAIAGIKYQQFHFTYSFGFNMFLSSYVKSSFHEISVNYRFKEEGKKLL